MTVDKFFSDNTFFFHKLSISQKNELTSLIKQYKGTVSLIYGKKITHLVTTPEEIRENGFKIQQAKSLNISVITSDFIHTSARKFEQIKAQSAKSTEQLALVPGSKSGVIETTASASIPTLTLILPSSGPNTGDFIVSIFGLEFSPGSCFRVRFTHSSGLQVEAVNYEFHASTAVICKLPECLLPPGPVSVSASNDGIHYGFPVEFLFIDTTSQLPSSTVEAKISIMHGQLQNLRRAMMNIQRLEMDLQNQLGLLTAHRSDLLPDNTQPLEEKPQASLQPKIDREIKVFLSSPFRDMQEEREYLVKRVFPQIRRLCNDRDIIFSFVDLRWGVTGVQAEQAVALLMCLRELDNSSILIGSFGERYGFCKGQEGIDRQSNEVLSRSFDLAAKEFPWVRKYGDRSFTEVEMRMILDKSYSGPEKSAWFYFRDPYYVEEVPDKDRHNYVSEGPASHLKLGNLKRDLLEKFVCRNYNRPASVAELVLTDLQQYITKKFPEDQALSKLEKERLRHQVYSRGFTRSYLPIEALYLLLDKYVTAESNTPIVISGESGIGKTAVLTNWELRHREHHPEDVIVTHWIGSTPSSSSFAALLWRLMAELNDLLILNWSIPLESEMTQQVVQDFPNWLDKAAQETNRRIVLIIDGLDKLDDRNNAFDLLWLPVDFPHNLRIILSASSPSAPMNVLKKRKYQITDLEPLDEAQRNSFVRMFLQLNAKKLSSQQELRIASSSQSSKPRFLRVLLDDILVAAVHANLDARIDQALTAHTPAELYELVLSRIESDYERHHSGGKAAEIAEFLSLVWGSRRGLLLTGEIDVLLGSQQSDSDKSDSRVLNIMHSVEDLLVECAGLVNFSNVDLRHAIKKRYLASPEKEIAVHERLAAHFARQKENITDRLAEELPWQFAKSNQLTKLRDCVADLRLLDKLYTPLHKFDLLKYWGLVEKGSAGDAGQIYTESLQTGPFPDGSVRGDLFFRVASFLEEMSKLDGALYLYEKAKELYRNSSQRLEVAKVDSALANVYSVQGLYVSAEEKLLSSLAIYLQEKGPNCVETALTRERLGVVYTALGKYDEAHESLSIALATCEKLLGFDHHQTSDVVYSVGSLYLTLHELEPAEEHFMRALKSKEAIFGDWHPEVARVVNRLGSLYIEQDEYSAAEECFRRALEIQEEKLGTHHLRVAQTLRHLMSLNEMKENYTQAIAVGQRSLTIVRAGLGENHPLVANLLIRIGSLYYHLKQPQNGKPLFKEAIEVRTRKFGATHKQTCDAISTFEELENPKKPVPVPPPPPPPPASFQKVLPPPKPKSFPPPPPGSKSGIPPPPPPPPPKYVSSQAERIIPAFMPRVVLDQILKKQQKQQLSEKQGQAPLLKQDDITQFSRDMLRKVQVDDRADAQKMFKAMVGLENTKNVKFKSRKK